MTSYYNKFIEEGIIDPNVHPWVAESWRRCDARKQNHETMPANGVRLSANELARQLELHKDVLTYVDGLFEQNKQYFNSHNLSMIIVDEKGMSSKTMPCRSSSGALMIFRACVCSKRTVVRRAFLWPAATMFPS